MLVKLYGLFIKVINNIKQRLFIVSSFLLIIRDKIFNAAINAALTTDGVNPVINTNRIKNIALITFILRFETFNFEKHKVMPIIKKFTCVPDTAKI